MVKWVKQKSCHLSQVSWLERHSLSSAQSQSRSRPEHWDLVVMLNRTPYHIKMALPKEAIPFLSQCLCQICVEILIKPVTLSCNHMLCNPCFQSTVKKASLCCPFCHRRVSSWTRYHTRRNSLINVEILETIQKNYPKECKRKVSGQGSEEIVDGHQPIHLLGKPGELRREYEEEISKVEAEP
ncbi:E3 ubiquitin-protein ligase RNF168 [Sciurus carolinensis]|uniref:RING-type E3 ubiquitin transferase n=1 Tax=Sciurus carolinensis TaxID=30640 RepID=A0AA41MXB5_SCICA|nr:E3 ubiquitin-protein ligase RNF168 [Sciurus carolinensis]